MSFNKILNNHCEKKPNHQTKSKMFKNDQIDLNDLYNNNPNYHLFINQKSKKTSTLNQQLYEYYELQLMHYKII